MMHEEEAATATAKKRSEVRPRWRQKMLEESRFSRRRRL